MNGSSNFASKLLACCLAMTTANRSGSDFNIVSSEHAEVARSPECVLSLSRA